MDATSVCDAPADREILEAMAMSDFDASRRVPAARHRLDESYKGLRSRNQGSLNFPFRFFEHTLDRAIRDAAGQAPRDQLVTLTKAALQFELWTANPNSWPTTGFAERTQHDLAVAASAAQQLQSLGLNFNAHAFVAAIRSRGVTIAVDADGKIVCSPARMLNHVDQEALRNPERRAAIAATLADAKRF